MRVGFGVMLIACSCVVDVAAETLHIEPGLWNVTYSYSLQGNPPAKVLANLSPEKRAAVMKAWAADLGKTKTNSSQTCITAEELASGTAFENDPDEPRQGCERSIGTQTSTQWNMVERCTGADGPAERNVQITAPGPRMVKGAMNSARGEGDAASGLNMTFTGHWVAKDCGEVR